MRSLESYYIDYINEGVKHKLTSTTGINIVLEKAIEFFLEKYGLQNTDIKVMLVKMPKGVGGHIDIAKIKESNKSKMVLKLDKTMSLFGWIRFMSHELTHAKQVIDGDLWYTKTHVTWMGRDYITLSEFADLMKKTSKSKDFGEYRSLPWEIDAYNNESTAYKDFEGSKQFQELKKLNDPVVNLIL